MTVEKHNKRPINVSMMKIHYSMRTMPVTMTLIALSCAISLITWFGHVHTTLDWFYYDESRIAAGQVWRLITPIFLHFPAMGIVFAHLAFNMIWLFQFGQLIERYDSPTFLLLLVVSAGLISNIAQAHMTYGLFGGMSGVVYALLGYLFVMKKRQPSYQGHVHDNIAYFLIGFMLLAAVGLFGGGIANTAHIVGFAVGVVFALYRSKSTPRNNRIRRL